MDFLNTVLPYVLDIVACLVVTAIGVAGTYASIKVGKNKDFERVASAIQLVTDVAGNTVLELQQTIVDELKADGGKLTQEQISMLQQTLVDKTIQQLFEPALNLLDSVKIDITALIRSAGEAMVQRLHAEAQKG